MEKPPHSQRWWVKIGDFGISKRVKNGDTAMRTQTGTPYFQAPEIQGFVNGDNETSEYSNAVDIWSLGCVIYNISAHHVPFTQIYDINAFCQGRVQLNENSLFPILSLAGIDFIRQLIVPDPVRRLTVQRALTHSWVSGVPSPDHFVLREPTHTSPTPNTEIEGAALHSPNSIPPAQQDTLSLPKERSKSPRRPVGAKIAAAQRAARLHDKAVLRHRLPIISMSSTDEMITVHRKTTASLKKDLKSSVTWSIMDVFQADEVWTVAFAPDNKLVALGSTDGTVQICDLTTKRTRHVLKHHSMHVLVVAFSPDGKLVASGAWDRTVQVSDVTTGKVCYKLNGHSSYVGTVAFSPDSTQVVSGSSDKTVRLWDVTTGETLHTLEGHLRKVVVVAFSSDGKLVFSGSDDDVVRLWDAVTGQVRHTINGHSEKIRAIAFSSDCRLIASTLQDNTIRLWDVTTGQVHHLLKGHSFAVGAVTFSPDGKNVASASYDTTVRIWDVTTGQICHILEGHSRGAVAIAFSPDGMLVVSGSEDNTLQLWHKEVDTKTPEIATN